MKFPRSLFHLPMVSVDTGDSQVAPAPMAAVSQVILDMDDLLHSICDLFLLSHIILLFLLLSMIWGCGIRGRQRD